MAAMIPGVSQPEIQRQVRQQRADIDALYELVERVDQKVDAMDVKLDRRFDEISGQLSEVLRQLGGGSPYFRLPCVTQGSESTFATARQPQQDFSASRPASRPRSCAPRSKRLRRHAAREKYLGAERFRVHVVRSVDPDGVTHLTLR